MLICPDTRYLWLPKTNKIFPLREEAEVGDIW